MADREPTGAQKWQEDDSRVFIDLGRFIVPERETQTRIVRDLIPGKQGPFTVLDLCCGEGLLAEAILNKFPDSTVYGYDGSARMLQSAGARLSSYGRRFQTRRFQLAEYRWRDPEAAHHAVISSLAIHHLTGPAKKQLYRDVFKMLEQCGVFIVADLVQPTGMEALDLAASEWDASVLKRSQELAGNTDAYDFFINNGWNIFRYPDPMDMPSPLFDQLKWLEAAGFSEVDVHWAHAGHAIFSGCKI